MGPKKGADPNSELPRFGPARFWENVESQNTHPNGDGAANSQRSNGNRNTKNSRNCEGLACTA